MPLWCAIPPATQPHGSTNNRGHGKSAPRRAKARPKARPKVFVESYSYERADERATLQRARPRSGCNRSETTCHFTFCTKHSARDFHCSLSLAMSHQVTGQQPHRSVQASCCFTLMFPMNPSLNLSKSCSQVHSLAPLLRWLSACAPPLGNMDCKLRHHMRSRHLHTRSASRSVAMRATCPATKSARARRRFSPESEP